MNTDLRAIGPNLNYWYPVGRPAEFPVGQPVARQLWDRRLVLVRDAGLAVRALEDRCLHRKVALSRGLLRDGHLVCPYHGWEYALDGRLARIPYRKPGAKLPRTCVPGFPVQEKGGLVWVLAGPSPQAAGPPAVPELDPRQWLRVRLDRVFGNHFAIGAINGMDYFHFHLHRRYQPWSDIEITGVQADENEVSGEYRITSRAGLPARIFKSLTNRRGDAPAVQSLKVRYVYPHHLAEVDDHLVVHAAFQPVGRESVRAFIDLNFRTPRWKRPMMAAYLKILHRLVFLRIQAEDAWIGELEQEANERFPDLPRIETNPISAAVEQLMLRKWREGQADLPAPARQADDGRLDPVTG